MTLATMVVPSTADAMITGYEAVEITARKVFLRQGGQRVGKGIFYGSTDKVGELSFYRLVQMVKERGGAQ